MESLEKILTDKEFAGGLPKGDTVLVIAEIKAEPSEFTDNQGRKKTRYKLAFPDGKEYFVPVSLMRDLQREARAGKKKVRITRTGEGMDTRYAALGIDG